MLTNSAKHVQLLRPGAVNRISNRLPEMSVGDRPAVDENSSRRG